MEGLPKISVIVPIYNAEKYLKKCLNSIIHQTFKDLEILCINDGSTDNSLKIIQDFSKKDARIKIFNTSNNGQGSARNLGLKHAAGEYISFIDADDWIVEDAYEKLYYKSNKYDLDILFFQMINYINSSGNLIESDLYNYEVLINNFDNEIPFSSKDASEFLFNIAVCPVSKLYKRKFLTENNIVFPENIIFEDNVFFYNAFLKADKISFINKHFYFRRRHSESITQNISEKSFDIVNATNKMLILFKDNNWYSKYKIPLINHTFSMILEWFFKSELTLCEDFYIKIKSEFLGLNEFKEDFNQYLNDYYHKIYKLFIENNHYLDFIPKYNLLLSEFDSIKNDDEYKVSVIIPFFNNDKLIHRTLMSIIHQSFGFENIEVILVDDNSNLGTDVIEDYSKKYDNIKIIHLKENTGSAGTPRNIGLIQASADYIMFLDHDDFFDVHAIEKLYSKILENNSDVVFGTYSIINNDNFHDVVYENEKNGYFKNILENERLIAFPPPSIWTKLFRKKFIIDNGFLFPPILGEDAIFMDKVLLNASGITYLTDVICFHDLNDKSTTNNITSTYLTEGLISEKYLYDLFCEIDKEYYFKYRLEGNLDFFLSQFLRSNLNKNEIQDIFPIFQWFIEKAQFFDVKPKKHNNVILMNYFVKKDIDAIYDFKIRDDSTKKPNSIKKILEDKYSIFVKKAFVKIKKLIK